MHMPLIALVGSASYAMKRPRTKLVLKSSFWLTTMLFSLTALTAQSGCFVPAVRSHTTLNVSLLTVNNRYKSKDGPSLALSMNVRVPKVKRVNPSRSTTRVTKRVTKQVTYDKLLSHFSTMVKQKFSKKGKGGKVHMTPEEKRDAMSHKNKHNQQWKEEKIEEAKQLWKANDEKDPKDRLSMRAIAKKLKLPKTTVLERLSGRCQGEGHIAGGKRKARVLTDSKQVGQNNRNRFNQTFNWVTKQVTPLQ